MYRNNHEGYMMKYLILVTILLLSLATPAAAQDPTPEPIPTRDPYEALAGTLADECGAIDYLMQRYEFFKVARAAQEGIDLTNPTAQTYADLHEISSNFRDGLLSITDIPDCVMELHLISIQNSVRGQDYLYYRVAVHAFISLTDEFQAKANEISVAIQEGNAAIEAIYIELGWFNDDKEIVIELTD